MNGNARHVGKMAWGILAWVLAALMSGCVSIPYDGKKVYGKPDVTTRTVGMEGNLEIHPEVERKGDVVRLRLVADGKFVEETTTTRTYKVEKRKLAVGVLPGFADAHRDWGPALLATVLVNGGMLGSPTLTGLLVEPFLPARGSGEFDMDAIPPSHRWRRMALVGFSKYTQGTESITETSKPSRRTVAKSQPVKQIALWFDAEPRFWESNAQKGDTLVLRGVEAGRHEGKLYIKSVPAGHEYKKELEKMEWVPIDVAIPE